MSDMNRREALTLIALAPLAASARAREADAAQPQAPARAAAPELKFFTPHEFATAAVLADLILPADERSGSATEAGVPEYMDFVMLEQPARQTAMRGGLAWIDREAVSRHGKTFLASTPAERAAVLDDIAWPGKARPEHSHGVAFFNSFRDLTASGFFTSRMGIADLQYMGNRYAPEWKGCPEEVLAKLGVQA